jgi:hypothetical protein
MKTHPHQAIRIHHRVPIEGTNQFEQQLSLGKCQQVLLFAELLEQGRSLQNFHMKRK